MASNTRHTDCDTCTICYNVAITRAINSPVHFTQVVPLLVVSSVECYYAFTFIIIIIIIIIIYLIIYFL